LGEPARPMRASPENQGKADPQNSQHRRRYREIKNIPIHDSSSPVE
jgi:hypothetical protein